jgi:CHAD domain-containing protein
MELFVTLDPSLLSRFRAQPILKSCRLGRTTSHIEQGILFDSEDLALQKRGISVTVIREGKRVVEVIRRGDGKAAAQNRSTDRLEIAPAPLPELPQIALQPRFRYRLTRSFCLIGGNHWQAEMHIERGDLWPTPDLEGPATAFCQISFHLLQGHGAPLAALLRALAETLPLRLTSGQAWDAAHDALRPGARKAVKAKPPPLPPDCANRQALRLIGRAGLAHLLANQACLLDNGDPEAVHQARVALRRLRSALSLFKPLLNDPESEAVRGELRWMQHCLGAARDNDVLLADIILPLERLYHGEPGYAALIGEIGRRRQEARSAMREQLKTPRFTQCLLRLACWIEEVGHDHPLRDTPLRNLALATLTRRYRQVRKRMMHFHALDETARHACRIEVKKLRYALDFFSGVLADGRSQKFSAQLAALQDRLGRLNDIATARHSLQQIVLSSGQAELGWAAGQIAGWHQHRVADLLDQAWEGWHAMEKLPPFWIK